MRIIDVRLRASNLDLDSTVVRECAAKTLRALRQMANTGTTDASLIESRNTVPENHGKIIVRRYRREFNRRGNKSYK